jgi:hypothetical protein
MRKTIIIGEGGARRFRLIYRSLHNRSTYSPAKTFQYEKYKSIKMKYLSEGFTMTR